MRLHEYEAKNLFKQYGIPIPEGDIARSAEEAVEIAKKTGFPTVLKAQVLVGGRGLAGGILFAENLGDVKEKAGRILNMQIKGQIAESILVEKKLEIDRELYVGITIDRTAGCPVVMVSSEGGVAIEETAAKTPEKVVSMHVDILEGLYGYKTRKLAKSLGLNGKTMLQFADTIMKLYKSFEQYDGLITEINPLVVTKDGSVVAADAVFEIDDASLYKYPQFRDVAPSRIAESQEREAKRIGVSYVGLPGDIGVICSGAGLGMATIDLIGLQGSPANFLETGGGITETLMADAMRLVLQKPGLRAVVINIYGGINPIHEGAKGIARVIEEDGISIPVVAKALGNFQEETWEILERAGVKVIKEVETERLVEELFKQLSNTA